MSLSNSPQDPSPQIPTEREMVPGNRCERVNKILQERPIRTLHGDHSDITVYGSGGSLLYCVKIAGKKQTMLYIDTSHPNQCSEVTAYLDGEYMGRTMIKLHGKYDEFATDYLTGKRAIDFLRPKGGPD